jgi:hypothetical protein
MNTPQQIRRLIEAAQEWALYQDPDSLEDQEVDPRLRDRANEAREKLLTAIEDLSDR